MFEDLTDIRPSTCSAHVRLGESLILLRSSRSSRVYQPHDRPPSRSVALVVRRSRKKCDRILLQIDGVLTLRHIFPRARDRPEKALGIEIYNACDYIRMRNHWNGCGLLLHELCHVIHQQVLGLDNQRVKDVYERVLKSGKYERVLRRDWAGKDGGEVDLSYAMIDYKECFAEMSVTFWADGYRERDDASNAKMRDCSPPITESGVLARLEKCRTDQVACPDEDSYQTKSIVSRWIGALENLFAPRTAIVHCNKFYPFTRGQMRHYDSMLFSDVELLWHDIAAWEDPNGRHVSCIGCWNIPWKSDFGKLNVLGDFEDSDNAVPPTAIPDTVDL